jgi:hypothetical protein
MYTARSSFALVGIEAVPVDVIVDGDRAEVVERTRRRVFHSVRLESTGSVASLTSHLVNYRTHPVRNLAPDYLMTTRTATEAGEILSV